MNKLSKSPVAHKDLRDLMCDLWDVEQKVRSVAVLFKEIGGAGSVMEKPSDLHGVGIILTESMDSLRNSIGQIDSISSKVES